MVLILCVSSLLSLGLRAVVIIILLCIAAIAVRIYQQKRLYKRNEAKRSENVDNAEAVLKSELNIQNPVKENQKEYFFWLAEMIYCITTIAWFNSQGLSKNKKQALPLNVQAMDLQTATLPDSRWLQEASSIDLFPTAVILYNKN